MKKSTEKTAVKTLTPKEAAAKHIAMKAAQKQAQADAAKDMAQADAAATPEATPEKKPARIPRQKPANKPPVAPVKPEETAPATDNKPEEKKPVEPSAKEKKQAARVEYVRKAAELAIKAGYNTPQDIAYRNKAEDVKTGDVVVYHTKTGFSQFLQVEHISKLGTLTLEVAQDDALKQRAGSAGAWTKESWDIDRIQNVFSKRGGHDKFLQVVFFGKK